MKFTIDKTRAVCPQIAEQICLCIAKNEFGSGDKLLSVREVASEAGVNPNTVQKAFELLQEKGLIFSVRGSGWYISEDTHVATEEFEKLIDGKIKSFFDEMHIMGFTDEEIKSRIKEWNV